MKNYGKLYAAALGIAMFVGASTVQAEPSNTSSPISSIVEKWLQSGHADVKSEAFAHWNEEGEIPPACATCHSGAGFVAFHGLDGSAPGQSDAPTPIGSVVDCVTCHRDGVDKIGTITFPSGLAVSNLGLEAACLTCHQGRQSTTGIDKALSGKAEDEANPELRFFNPHYAAAGATLYGTEAKGAYEYAGKVYAGRFAHVPPFSQCSDCHDPHALEVVVEDCVSCHQTNDPLAMRFSPVDFNGNGNVSEGVYNEIAGGVVVLDKMIADYANKVLGAPIIYAEAYPYYFNDTNGNGAADADETVRANAFASWTPRLLKAAYNYQFVTKDKGAFAHNPKYVQQVLFDSIESLATKLDMPMDAMTRP